MAQMPLSNNAEATKTETVEETDSSTPTLLLRLEQPRDERRVGFHEGVIDNEHMNRMKSKCCCIYKKPLAFGESSSEDDDECEHCFGHPEKRKKNKKKPLDANNDACCQPDQPSTSAEVQAEPQDTSSNPKPAGAKDIEPSSEPDFETTVKPSL